MTDEIFRREALAHWQQQPQAEESKLTLPQWIYLTYGLLGVLAIVAVLVGFKVFLPAYAGGPATIHAVSRIEAIAPVSGTVKLDVERGTGVQRGQVVARVLPSRGGKALSVVAAADGLAADLRVRSGQHVDSGDLLLVVDGSSTSYEMSAIVPASVRSLLEVGQRANLHLDEFRGAEISLSIIAIDPEGAPGTANAGRVIVRGQLDDTSLHFEGTLRHYATGMRGVFRPHVGMRPLLAAISGR